MEANENPQSMNALLKLLVRSDEPFNERVVDMDCKDDCEDIASIAERVANGEKLQDVYPEFADHIDQIGCCKEEFQALVKVLQELKNDEAQ